LYYVSILFARKRAINALSAEQSIDDSAFYNEFTAISDWCLKLSIKFHRKYWRDTERLQRMVAISKKKSNQN
jgi:hypothetical protein